MIKHIALFNLKDAANGKTKDENKSQILRNVERLKNEVPVKKRIEAAPQLSRDRNNPWAADLAVYVEFESLTDYDAYLAHPLHKEAADFAASVSDHAEGITFESAL